jgi:hypothetical protein
MKKEIESGEVDPDDHDESSGGGQSYQSQPVEQPPQQPTSDEPDGDRETSLPSNSQNR